MAGFRAEEYAVARGLLDSLGAQDVKVLPASQEMLQVCGWVCGCGCVCAGPRGGGKDKGEGEGVQTRVDAS